MVDDLQKLFVFELTIGDVIANVLVAFICGTIISLLFRYIYSGTAFKSTFANSIIMLSMITAISIMVIGNNLARAFGMVGALSIIRFRTSIQDTFDIMFIFFALAVGLASGVGFFAIAFFGTFFIGFIVLVLSKLKILNRSKNRYNLEVICDPVQSQSSLALVIGEYCFKVKLMKIRTIGKITRDIEYSYSIILKEETEIEAFVNRLKEVESIKKINLMYEA